MDEEEEVFGPEELLERLRELQIGETFPFLITEPGEAEGTDPLELGQMFAIQVLTALNDTLVTASVSVEEGLPLVIFRRTTFGLAPEYVETMVRIVSQMSLMTSSSFTIPGVSWAEASALFHHVASQLSPPRRGMARSTFIDNGGQGNRLTFWFVMLIDVPDGDPNDPESRAYRG